MKIGNAIKEAYKTEKDFKAKRLLRELIVSLNKDGRGVIEISHIALQFGKIKNGLGVDLTQFPQYAKLSGSFDFKEPMDLFSKDFKTNSKSILDAVNYAQEENNEILHVPEMWYFNMYNCGHKDLKTIQTIEMEGEMHRENEIRKNSLAGKVKKVFNPRKVRR